MPSRRKPQSSARLADYRRKRRPGATPEPFGGADGSGMPETPSFVIQEHHARARHFDLRLEIEGVLKSWAVPKGPSVDPADKRLARLVEDHPLEYAGFEGRIPEGNYGAGWVIVWDRGTYTPLGDMVGGLDSGKLLFELNGCKLHGRWTLVRMKSANDWLLIKEQDSWARSDGEPLPDTSVLSGLTALQLPASAEYARRFARRVARQRGTAAAPDTPDLRPMLASAGEAFDAAGWVFELKYDGYRLIAVRDGESVTLWSRNGLPLHDTFPDVVHALAALPYTDFVFDGEVVVAGVAGRPDFSRLQQRVAVSGEQRVRRAARRLPATYYVFDLLGAAGRDLRPLPLESRKKLLETLLPALGPVRYSEHVATHGLATFDTARRLGMEGIVAKRAAAPYRPGRSRDWIKVRARNSDDFVILGWSAARGNASDIGALALGEFRAGLLSYVGKVGSGLGGAVRAELAQRFAVVARGPALDPDPSISWLDPVLVCEVAFREYTAAGHLRQPVFERLRDDKPPDACVGHFDDPQPAKPREQAHEVTVSNRDKVFFPELDLTKGDLIGYYEAIAPWMLPYLAQRPLVLTRFPDGIHGKRFYQRDAPAFVPDWIERQVLWSEGAEREVHYFIAHDAAALVYLANLGTIPIHTWHSRTIDLEHPDWCVLDLDPKDAPFRYVVQVAKAAHTLTREIGLPAFLKTSGASGLHVLIPLDRQLSHDQARTLGELLANVLVTRLPDIATVTRSVRRREGKVYVDYLQNGHGKLLVAPYSARAEPAASVSMPLRWHELNGRLSNERFTIRNALRRVRSWRADPLREVLESSPDIPAALSALLEHVEGSSGDPA